MTPLVTFRDGFYLAPPAHLTVPDRCPEPAPWLLPDLQYPARRTDKGADLTVPDWEGRAHVYTYAEDAERLMVLIPRGALFDTVIVERQPTPESSARLDRWRDGFVRGAMGKRAASDRIVRARCGAWLDGYHNGRNAYKRQREQTKETP